MIQTLKRMAAFALAALASVGLLATPAQAQSEQQQLVDAATKTLSNFLRDPDMTWLQNNIGRATGLHARRLWRFHRYYSMAAR